MALISIFLLGFIEISFPLPVILAMDGPIEPAFLVIAVSGTLGKRCSSSICRNRSGAGWCSATA